MGIPSPRWQVGGGVYVKYKAPRDGNVYVVDHKSGRFIVTESVEGGEDFTFAPSTQEQLDILGSDPQTAKIVVYFVPATVFYPEETPEQK
jgi:hypothetical protein